MTTDQFILTLHRVGPGHEPETLVCLDITDYDLSRPEERIRMNEPVAQAHDLSFEPLGV